MILIILTLTLHSSKNQNIYSISEKNWWNWRNNLFYYNWKLESPQRQRVNFIATALLRHAEDCHFKCLFSKCFSYFNIFDDVIKSVL